RSAEEGPGADEHQSVPAPACARVAHRSRFDVAPVGAACRLAGIDLVQELAAPRKDLVAPAASHPLEREATWRRVEIDPRLFEDQARAAVVLRQRPGEGPRIEREDEPALWLHLEDSAGNVPPVPHVERELVPDDGGDVARGPPPSQELGPGERPPNAARRLGEGALDTNGREVLLFFDRHASSTSRTLMGLI